MGKPSIKELGYTAALCRRKVLRMIEAGGAGHMGGAMSCIDIVTALYFYAMNLDPANPKMPERDRFVLSAGHKCMAQYAVLCQKGFFDEKVLDSYGSLNSKIPGHPDMYKLPGVEANTGALGHGLSIGLGMALGLRMDGAKAKTFVVMGDGELAEGSNWEAAAAAAQFKADNLAVFVDCNGLQISGKTRDIMDMNPAPRFAAFGWAVREIDGNSMDEITAALDALPFAEGKPSLIAAHTVKARGVSFAEGIAKYHYWKPSAEELQKAIAESEKKIEEAKP
ncbi:MAG: transketolase [Spirochaetia bacterium]|jgi:transketolase|nr:transketolase [Spirochaetia bacterium]